MGIIKFEFEAKTQFLTEKNGNHDNLANNKLFVTSFF